MESRASIVDITNPGILLQNLEVIAIELVIHIEIF